VATSWHRLDRTHVRSSITLDIRTSSTPSVTPSYRQIASRISGKI